ncbi:MAG: TonB-dependent receptor [Opitutus sp.]
MFLLLAVGLTGGLRGQGAVTLPEVTVYSHRVANQSPAGTFAMPVSALRYEPRIDLQARNLAEAQADVTLRGGIFENTGIQLGAVTLFDPQTGHYVAEIPVAPALLSEPEIVTGAALASRATNATAGAIAYAWRPIRTTGAAAISIGGNNHRRGELYQGYAGPVHPGGSQVAVDMAYAHSESEGAIPFGDHEFWRVNGRLQWAAQSRQTDLFAGYQEKFFGWTNLYTPFNSPEAENLQTVLFALNHRANFGGGEFLEAGIFHRRNKDDYAFNRFTPLGAVHPFQHTTWVSGAALSGRRQFKRIALNVRAEILADKIHSTSLVHGRFNTRTLGKVALVPEWSWRGQDGGRWTARMGGAYDDSNRDRAALTPVFELASEERPGVLSRVHAGYSRNTQLATYTALNSSASAGLFRGNPGLGRAVSHNFEVGARGTIAGWTGDAVAFWRRDDALVDWTFRQGVTARSANEVDVQVGGFEIAARRSWRSADLVIGYTWLTKDADYRGVEVDASFYALNYARHRLTAAVTLRFGRGLELRIDNIARIQAENLLRVIGGDRALTSSIGLAYRPPSWKHIELGIRVENAWDGDFQDVPAVPAAPRQISFNVASKW